MLALKNLKLVGFKSHLDSSYAFAQKFNCFVGMNGAGKTNILDAIYFLCMTKSHSGLSDKQLVNHDAPFFRLDATFQKEGKNMRVVAKMPQNGKKTIECEEKTITRLADHIGRIPVVMIAPDDVYLVTEGGEMRRRFMDTTLSQTSQAYMTALMQYNNTLKQRNALLKQANDTGHLDHQLLDIYDRQLIGPAELVYSERKAFFDTFSPIFARKYQEIAGGREEVAIRYESIMDDAPLHETLLQRRERDRVLQRTTQGIHRDELVMLMDNQPVRDFGSQGQLKSYLLAMRLAQFSALHQACGTYPILLLDDIFDKLDMHRVAALITLLRTDSYGQIFFTDTQRARIEAVTIHLSDEVEIWEVG
jgi:DNA replication and repair protein RecF